MLVYHMQVTEGHELNPCLEYLFLALFPVGKRNKKVVLIKIRNNIPE